MKLKYLIVFLCLVSIVNPCPAQVKDSEYVLFTPNTTYTSGLLPKVILLNTKTGRVWKLTDCSLENNPPPVSFHSLEFAERNFKDLASDSKWENLDCFTELNVTSK